MLFLHIQLREKNVNATKQYVHIKRSHFEVVIFFKIILKVSRIIQKIIDMQKDSVISIFLTALFITLQNWK